MNKNLLGEELKQDALKQTYLPILGKTVVVKGAVMRHHVSTLFLLDIQDKELKGLDTLIGMLLKRVKYHPEMTKSILTKIKQVQSEREEIVENANLRDIRFYTDRLPIQQQADCENSEKIFFDLTKILKEGRLEETEVSILPPVLGAESFEELSVKISRREIQTGLLEILQDTTSRMGVSENDRIIILRETCGWGGVERGEIGTVQHIGNSMMAINFPESYGSGWNVNHSPLRHGENLISEKAFIELQKQEAENAQEKQENKTEIVQKFYFNPKNTVFYSKTAKKYAFLDEKYLLAADEVELSELLINILSNERLDLTEDKFNLS